MAKIIPFLKFDNSLEAISFYEHLFGDNILVERNSLDEESAKTFGLEADENATILGVLNLGGSLVMFSDNFGNKENNNASILINFDDDNINHIAKMEEIFEKANNSYDCKIKMPLIKRNWGGRMSIFEDKYGNTWLLHSESFEKASQKNDVFKKFYSN